METDMYNNVNAALNDAQYSQLEKFVRALSQRDSETLQTHFQLSDVVIAEVYERVEFYFDHATILSVPPRINCALQGPSIAVYDFGDGDLAVDCDLLGNGSPCDAYVHVLFEKDVLVYEYMKS